MTQRFSAAANVALRVTIVGILVLVLSGGALFVRFRPLEPATVWLSRVHLFAVVVTAQAIVVSGVLGLITSERASESARRALGLATALAAIIVSTLTGRLLRWDQLALWAVTTGEEIRGFRWIFGDRVRFALLGDAVVGVDTMRRLLVVHVGSALVLIAAGIGLPMVLRRRRSPGQVT